MGKFLDEARISELLVHTIVRAFEDALDGHMSGDSHNMPPSMPFIMPYGLSLLQ